MLTHSEKILRYVLEMCQDCLKCHFLNQEKSHRKGWRPENLPSSRPNPNPNPKFLNCAKTAKGASFGTEKKVKLKDSEYKNSSLVGQIDRTNNEGKK